MLPFKKSKKPKALRSKKSVIGNNEDDSNSVPAIHQDTSNEIELQDILELRKLRKRPPGLGADELVKGDPKSKKQAVSIEEAEDAVKKEGSKFASTFKTQTKALDTEKHMWSFIQKELLKKRLEGMEDNLAEEWVNGESEKKDGDDDMLFDAPEHLRAKEKPLKESNAGFSNSLLTNIPEVDLGIDNKIKNIEATERAKQMLMVHQQKQQAEVKEMLQAGILTEEEQRKLARQNRKQTATDSIVFDNFKKRLRGLPK